MFKKFMLHVMATTGITLVVLAVIAACFQGTVIYVKAVFESFLVNLLIHTGYSFFKKKEYRYPIVETMLEMGYTVIVVLIAGQLFGWYDSMPLWCLLLMAILVYVLGIVVSAVSILGEVSTINKLIKRG